MVMTGKSWRGFTRGIGIDGSACSFFSCLSLVDIIDKMIEIIMLEYGMTAYWYILC